MPTNSDDSLFATAGGFGREKQLPTLRTLIERLFVGRIVSYLDSADYISGLNRFTPSLPPS